MTETAVNSTNPPEPQRRRHFRAKVITGSALSIRAWKIAVGIPLQQRPMPSQEIKVEILDIGHGGFGAAFAPRPGQTLAITKGDRLRFEFKLKEEVVLVEGRLREPSTVPKPDGSFLSGVGFVGRNTDLVFRKALEGISGMVGFVQREELRFRKQISEAS